MSSQPCGAYGSIPWLDRFLLLFLVLPNLAWNLLDRGIHAGDPGAHAFDAMRVYHALSAGAWEWWRELMGVTPKPPMAMWLAHLGAPFGKWLGHFDAGLLLPTIMAGYVALLLLYKSLNLLYQDRIAALAGCLTVAAAPLWLTYARGLWMQPLQLLAVCWFLWIMAAAQQIHRLAGLLHLAAAAAFSLLVMTSTPLYCVLPGTIALVRVLGGSPRPARGGWKKYLPLATLTALLLFLFFAWYLRNWDTVVEHAQWASRFGYNVSVHGFLPKLTYWLGALATGALLLPMILAALAVFSTVVSGQFSSEERKPGIDWPAIMALLQIVLVLVVLSLADNQEKRYVLPLLAHVGILIAWTVRKLKRRWPVWALLAILGTQFLLVQTKTFGVPLPGHRLPGSAVLRRDAGRLGELLDEVSNATKPFPPGKILLTTQGLAHCGLMFSALDIQFREAKKPGYDRIDARAYESVEFHLARTRCDVEELWKQAQKPGIAGVVVINEKYCPPDVTREHGYRTLFDAAREFSRRVRRSGCFTRVHNDALPEVEIWRHTASTGSGSVKMRSGSHRTPAYRYAPSLRMGKGFNRID